MTSELTTQQLDEIETRAASLHEYALLADAPLQADADQLTGEDVPALIAAVRRLNAALADQQTETEKLIRWHREGDDPVTPGTCTDCDPDDDRHDFVEAQPGKDTETPQPKEA